MQGRKAGGQAPTVKWSDTVSHLTMVQCCSTTKKRQARVHAQQALRGAAQHGHELRRSRRVSGVTAQRGRAIHFAQRALAARRAYEPVPGVLRGGRE